MLGMFIEGSDFDLERSDEGNELLAVVARLCLPPYKVFQYIRYM